MLISLNIFNAFLVQPKEHPPQFFQPFGVFITLLVHFYRNWHILRLVRVVIEYISI
jgi:hypothetical protein